MEKQIRARLEKGRKPTKKQIEWIKDNTDPKFKLKCEHCAFNLFNYFGLLK